LNSRIDAPLKLSPFFGQAGDHKNRKRALSLCCNSQFQYPFTDAEIVFLGERFALSINEMSVQYLPPAMDARFYFADAPG
jgi:hypothetical protein